MMPSLSATTVTPESFATTPSIPVPTSLIVGGFCKEVFRELPMEFAVEAQRLLSISLEGSVG